LSSRREVAGSLDTTKIDPLLFWNLDCFVEHAFQRRIGIDPAYSNLFKPAFVVRKRLGPKGPGLSIAYRRGSEYRNVHCHYGMVRVTVVVCITPPPVPFTVIV
jgi:hypothetical protein